MDNTDNAWRQWGLRDPYFGVLTSDAYRLSRLSEEAKSAFFETGRQHFEHVLAVIRERLDPRFQPRRAVDFGCGTGRVLIPMAGECEETLGLDVSDGMLTECLANCRRARRHHVILKLSADRLSGLSGEYDLIHSFIVFQHIPARRGERLAATLLKHLDPRGVAVLHFTYRWEAGWRERFMYFVRHHVPFAHRFMNRLRGEHPGDPKMQMNLYDLNRLRRLFDAAGVRRTHVEWVRHGNHHGAVYYLSKRDAAEAFST